MEIPVTHEWVDPSLLDVVSLIVQMVAVFMVFGIIVFLVSAIITSRTLPKSNFKQMAVSFLVTLVITAGVGYYGYWAYPQVEKRGTQEVITDESIGEQTEEVYGYTMVKQTKTEFPKQHNPEFDYWYLFTDKEGNEHECEVVFSEPVDLKSVNGISWKTTFLHESDEARAFRDSPERHYSARLLCEEDKEPTKI